MELYIAIAAAAVCILSTSICIFFIIFTFFPHYLIRLGFIFRQYQAGMKIKFVGDENFVFCYGEKNSARLDKTSIVFIHGFSSSKDQWVANFMTLPKDLHLIAVDLPGHGASSVPDMNVTLNLDYVVESLEKFFTLVGLTDKKVHIVGSSLGGAVAGLFTARYPERVEKLTMICPAMQTPVDSEFAIQLREIVAKGTDNITTANCKLVPVDLPGIKAMLDACFYNKDIKFSDKICKGFLHLRLPKTDFYLRLFKGITSAENMGLLERTAPKITVPTQLIWGQQDELIHVSGAELLKSKLPNCQRVDIIDKCGHAIDIDHPQSFTKFLLLFIHSDQLDQIEDKKNM
uniref:acylglycerol lipase n=1 Tax=Arion vulgaris TaxID=1028688 RepID=A0A0B7ABT1_9EUPU